MEKRLPLFEELSAEIVSSDKFRSLYGEVLKLQYLGTRSSVNLSFDDIKFLLKTASIFAFSNDKCKQISYKIATTLSERYSVDYDQLNMAVQYIIITSGQLPVVRKNIDDGHQDYFSTYQSSEVNFNPMMYRSIIMRQALNRLSIKFEGNDVFFTDFQSRSFEDLEKEVSMSISAPTSAGKSFLLKSFLAKRFKEREKFNVVYIVPTRALISQVQRDFRKTLKDFEASDVLISSSSNFNKTDSSKKKLFILTQERFHNLLFDSEFKEPLNVLIIDEAQKVSDGSRGILLEEVIEEAIKRNKEQNASLQKIFLSPFTKNPEKFAAIFRLEDLQIEKTRLSPVSQNLLQLDVKENSFHLSLITSEFEKAIDLEKGELQESDFAPFAESKDSPLLWAARKFGKEFNIIYSNSPAACVSNALIFSRTLPLSPDPDIEAVISFLRETVHSEYYLIQCLRKGVAYHYGGMPNQIRVIIEDMFKSKKIRYIFCTSTLLEGVNLPAQSIFISKPTKGKTGMDRLNFWNLAGRAGRLLKDYYGDIICINIDAWPGYKPNPDDVEQDIESILESTFINKNKEILEYLKQEYISSREKDRPIEQAIARFIIHEMKGGDTSFISNLLSRNEKFEQDKLIAIHEAIQGIAKQIELPAEIIQKNSSINPLYLQRLLMRFRQETPVLPVHPTNNLFFDNTLKIYKLIDEFFLGKKNMSHLYYATLTNQWITGKSIPELIKFKIAKISKMGVPTDKMINNEIDSLFNDINNCIRYDYQKYLKCYIDVLLFYYKESGYETAKICENIPQYLEYGTYRVNVLIMQSMGLSRATSIALDTLTSGASFSDDKDCMNWLKLNSSRIQKKLSRFLWIEVEELI